jgi:AAA domain-containing protein
MRRFIITGAPGAGKTAIIRQLELDGFSVVEEAATDIIAAAQAQGTVQPWTHPSFIDVVANLQKDRQIRASYQPDEVQFHDRWLFVRRRWQSTSGTFFHLFLPANWSASKKKQSTKTEPSLFAILASSRLPKRGESALRIRCVLSKFTKRRTETSGSSWSQSSQEVWWNESAQSKRQFVSRSGLP